MKLIEKLARKYAEDQYPDYMEDDRGAACLSFMDGFKAARDMAVKLTKAPAWMVVRDMPKLGEEEIK